MHESARRATERYLTPEAASRYEGVHRDRARHHREVRCIERALADLPPGSRVLDLPCGAGRMFEALAGLDFRITGIDHSPAMLAAAERIAQRLPQVQDLREGNVFETDLPSRSFDAVLCNRLLHHFAAPQDRQKALRELARLSRGVVVASFFCTASLDGLRTRWKRARRGTASGRSAIPYRRLLEDVESAGLRVERVLRTLPGISKQWYVVARA